MSGGHFHYGEYQCLNIADEIERLIETNDDPPKETPYGPEGGGAGYSPETLAIFAEGARIMRMAYAYARAIDYLVSSDIGEDGLLRMIRREMAQLERDRNGDA